MVKKDKNKFTKKDYQKVNKLSQKTKELESQLKQALADYHNLSRRIEGQQLVWQERSAARIVDKLLDVYEDLLRAKQSLKDKGLSMAVNQLWAILESEGVAEIEAKGKEFDPESMDCLQVVKGKKNRVEEIITRGYSFKGEVIRPVKVKVGQGS